MYTLAWRHIRPASRLVVPRRSGFVILPPELPCPTARADLLPRLPRSKARACFVWVIVRERSEAPSKGYWHLCRVVGGGARGPACRVLGSIGGVWSVAIALNTRQRSHFVRCAARSARRSGSSASNPSCWYLPYLRFLFSQSLLYLSASLPTNNHHSTYF